MNTSATNDRHGSVEQKKAQRKTLIVFLSFFIAPVLIAYCLLATGWWNATGSVNQGELITPPVALGATVHHLLPKTQAAQHRTKSPWLLITAIDSECGLSCRNALMLIRQTHTLLGPKQHRIQPLLLHKDPLSTDTVTLLKEVFPLIEQIQFDLEAADALAALQRLQPSVVTAPNAPEATILVVDPLGNAMMRHQIPLNEESAITKGRGFVKDLKRLLKYSRIG